MNAADVEVLAEFGESLEGLVESTVEKLSEAHIAPMLLLGILYAEGLRLNRAMQECDSDRNT